MITDNYLEQLREVFVTHNVILAYLFGSQAKGIARQSSDVDIAVLLSNKVPRTKYFDIRLALTNDIATILNKDLVDVAILNEATATLAHEVVRSGKTIYEDLVELPKINFIVQTMKYYADTDHFRKLSLHSLSQSVQSYRRQQSLVALREKNNDQQ